MVVVGNAYAVARKSSLHRSILVFIGVSTWRGRELHPILARLHFQITSFAIYPFKELAAQLI